MDEKENVDTKMVLVGAATILTIVIVICYTLISIFG
jgi:hypothetical protein